MKLPNPFARWSRKPLLPPEALVAPRPALKLTPRRETPPIRHFEPHTLTRLNLAGDPNDDAFDYSAALAAVALDVSRRTPTFAHLRLPEMMFTVTSARNASEYGLQARLTPMRFEDGGETKIHRNRAYRVQRYTFGGVEILYLVTFCVPRFLEQSFREKLVTLFHELYHVGPNFDGDLRRHAGRCHVHTHSQKQYDAQMGRLVDAYLASDPDPELLAFLRLSPAGLAAAYGRVTGVAVPRPKMLPIRS